MGTDLWSLEEENARLKEVLASQEQELEELRIEQVRLKRKELRALYRRRMIQRHPAVVLEEIPSDDTFDFNRREMQIMLMEEAYDAMLRMVDNGMNDVAEEDFEILDEYHDLYRFHRQWHIHPDSTTPIIAQSLSMNEEPWKTLLDAYSNGNPNKFKYLSSWIRYMLLGGNVGTTSAQFPAGVELSFLSKEIIEGFSRILIPALQEYRPDLNVHVFSKSVVDTTLRIVVMPKNRNRSIGKTTNESISNGRPPTNPTSR